MHTSKWFSCRPSPPAHPGRKSINVAQLPLAKAGAHTSAGRVLPTFASCIPQQERGFFEAKLATSYWDTLFVSRKKVRLVANGRVTLLLLTPEVLCQLAKVARFPDC